MGKPRILLLPTPIVKKQAGQLKKLFGLWDRSKRKDPVKRELSPPTNIMKDGVPDFLSQTRGLRNTHVTRRQIMLNRHFTEIVSDVLAQSFKKELDDLGISITSIETKAWNKGLCVFYSNKSHYDEQSHKELNKLTPDILSAITERRLTGRTPKLHFVYDRSIQVDEHLSNALSNINIDMNEETQVTTASSTQLYISKDLGTSQPTLISRRFRAPTDMDNTMFGLDYPILYDEVSMKLSRGRGESARMKTNFNMLTEAKPLFRAPKDTSNEEDPMKRLLRMRKFIISQKQKTDKLANSRRKAEIYARNSVKWQIVDDNDETLDKDEVTAQ